MISALNVNFLFCLLKALLVCHLEINLVGKLLP